MDVVWGFFRGDAVVVFRKFAAIEHAELRRHIRPAVVGRGFAAIVEAGPDEAAGNVRALRNMAPPGFGGAGPPGVVQVVGAGVTAFVVALIVAAHRHGAAGFAAVDRDVGVLRVEAIHLAGAVVETDHRMTQG
ncbi:hypothetical protein ADT26_07585 [Xanthomonas oryzae]|nr:hypothetical protein ADT26_07585 [Xanthomonas oryzae]